MERFIEFAGNHPLLLLAAGLVTMAVAFNEFRVRGRGGSELPPGDAVKLINAGALVLDVRSSDQYAGGHITSARHVAVADLAERAGEFLKKFESKAVLTYDDTGALGSRAAATLRKAGFKHVFNLQGGLGAWQREHLPLEKSTGGKA